jgi:hypothetical protein
MKAAARIARWALAGCLAAAGCSGNRGAAGDAEGLSDAEVQVDTEIGGDVAPDVEPQREYSPVVFAVVSDIHIDGAFEESVPQKVAALLKQAAEKKPAPELLVVTGDLTDTLYEPVETGEGSRIDALKKVFESVPLPVEAALGNHDYYATDDPLFALTKNPAAREALFKSELGLEPWYYTEHGGMRFVYLDSMHGPRGAETLGLNGCLGDEQLAWLDALLADGVAAVLFLHHPPGAALEAGEATLESVIKKHAGNILAVFVGHVHVWARSDIGGVPLYVTAAGFGGQALHHVRVDPAAGTVEILNEAEIDYGETVETPCDPAQELPLANPAALEGVVLSAWMPDAHIEPVGLGTYLRELAPKVPLVLRLGQPGEGGKTLFALLVSGRYEGDAAEGLPPYVAGIEDGECLPVSVGLDGPCFETGPVTLTPDLAQMLGVPLLPGWRLRAELRDLVLTGVLADGGVVDHGVLRATLDLSLGIEDVQGIIVQEYCAGTLEGCQPGAAGMPACPESPGPDFFSEVPEKCDFTLFGAGLRMVFAILESVPGNAVQIDANFSTVLAAESETALPGRVAPGLFAAAPEGTCPADE